MIMPLAQHRLPRRYSGVLFNQLRRIAAAEKISP